MTDSIPHLVGDVITACDTDEQRRKAASDLIAYSLGALVAIDGEKRAAEVAYRHADAVLGSGR